MTDATLQYCMTHSSPPDAVLNALERETHLRTLSPQMLSGPYQGLLLQFISQMIRPQYILEIGTFTGYASICLAKGLAPEGKLHTIEVDDELTWIIRKYLQQAGIQEQVELHNGDAAEIVPTLPCYFDLVFLDAGKLDYPRHFELALEKTRPGGFILADNILWGGKVVGNDQKDATARVLRTFNNQILQDERVENILLPLRDGLMIIRKR